MRWSWLQNLVACAHSLLKHFQAWLESFHTRRCARCTQFRKIIADLQCRRHILKNHNIVCLQGAVHVREVRGQLGTVPHVLHEVEEA